MSTTRTMQRLVTPLIRTSKQSATGLPAVARAASTKAAASSSSGEENTSKKTAPTPTELISIQPGPTARSRLQQHYSNTLSHDLLYLLYHHEAHANSSTLPNPTSRSPIWSPDNPYAVNRPPPRPKGNRYLVPNPSYTSSKSIPKLESIVLSSMNREALTNKSTLIALQQFISTITGEVPQSIHSNGLTSYGPGSNQGITVTRSTKNSASFKVRAGMPTGVKVELKGQPMYDLLDTLIEFVLPRWKTFNGVALPPRSTPKQNPSSTSGVVSFGLPPETMSLWPQVEINLDQYPRTYGMNIYFITSAKGRGAQDQARALLSGMGLPFVKR